MDFAEDDIAGPVLDPADAGIDLSIMITSLPSGEEENSDHALERYDDTS